MCLDTSLPEERKKRISEHAKESSPVGDHMKRLSHTLDETKVVVLEQEHRWFERGVREAIHIRGCSPSLNRDQGRHQLPAIYNSLISSQRDRNVTSKVTRQPFHC